MKNKKLIFIILSFIAFNITYGQSVKETTKIFGINLSQTIDNTHYQKSSLLICDTIFSFKTRPFPSGLTWDGQNLWYVDTSYIYKVSSTGMYIDSIINPVSNTTATLIGGGLTYDGINLWYADEETANLFKIDPTNGNVLQEFNLPSFGQSDPNGFGLSWDGNNIWHSQYIPPRLYKLNPTNGNIIDSLTPTSMILGIEWVNGNLYGISGQQVFKINHNTGAFQDSSSWCVPFSLDLTWDGYHLWNVSGQDSISGIPTGGKQRIYKLNSDLVSSFSEHSNINSDVEIFPNPFSTQTSLHSDNIFKDATLRVYNSFGHQVKQIKNISGQTIILHRDNLLSGLYFIRITQDNKVITTDKLVITD